jgi:hypothetical protein
MRRESITWPVILIVVGAFFLVKKWIPDFHLFELIREWWPALLIVIGVIMLAQRLAGGKGR